MTGKRTRVRFAHWIDEAPALLPSNLLEHLVVIRVGTDPEPQHALVVALANGSIMLCDAHGINGEPGVNSFELQTVVPRINLESTIRFPCGTLDGFGQRLQSVTKPARGA